MKRTVPTSQALLAACLAPGAVAPSVPRLPGAGEHVHWSGATAHELLTFYVGGQLHALPIREVREVTKLRRLTKVPRLPRSVLGVMSLRGELLPVVDAAQAFAAQRQPSAIGDAPARAEHIIVLGEEDGPLGLAVGHMLGVRRLPHEAVVARAVQPGGPGLVHPRDCVAAFAMLAGETVVVLDAEAVAQRFAEL